MGKLSVYSILFKSTVLKLVCCIWTQYALLIVHCCSSNGLINGINMSVFLALLFYVYLPISSSKLSRRIRIRPVQKNALDNVLGQLLTGRDNANLKDIDVLALRSGKFCLTSYFATAVARIKCAENVSNDESCLDSHLFHLIYKKQCKIIDLIW